MKFGPEIATDKVRPAWLLDTDTIQFCVDGDWTDDPKGYPAGRGWSYGLISAIRLPADHPYYLATSKGFTYWPGGESAPDDWDGDLYGVIYRDNSDIGRAAYNWRHFGADSDIIGYRRKTKSDAVSIIKITRAEAYEDGLDIPTLEKLGLLKAETLLEKFSRENPYFTRGELNVVRQFIDWQEGK